MHAFSKGMILRILWRTHVCQLTVPIAQDDCIRALPRADDAGYNAGIRDIGTTPGCLPSTRELTLNTIDEWLDDTDTSQPPVFWMWGLAGTGKSAVAQTVATRQANRKRLGASFFFSRDHAQQNSALLLFPTIAFQLASFDPRYKGFLCESLDEAPSAPHAQLQEQLSTLIVKPILACGPRATPLVIVIDALDECEPESEVEKIVRVCAAELPKLQGFVKVLITSRPESLIDSRYRSTGLKSIAKPYFLHDIDRTVVREDIKRYLTHHLQVIREEFGVEDPGWPDSDDVNFLMTLADAFFIVAATAIKFIGDRHWNDPRRQLRALKRAYHEPSGGDKSLDAVGSLYLNILNQAVGTGEPALLARVKDIVGAIVLLQNPMSPSSLDSFLEMEPGTVRSALSRLHSLLLVPLDQSSPIRVFHQSFPEFMTGRLRCDDSQFQLDPSAGHARLAALCLKHIASLRPDICHAGNFSRLNSEIPDLKDRLANILPNHLRYACVSLAFHLANSSPGDIDLPQLVVEFTETQLLVWIEVLSYLESLDIAVPALRTLQQWYKVSSRTFPVLETTTKFSYT